MASNRPQLRDAGVCYLFSNLAYINFICAGLLYKCRDRIPQALAVRRAIPAIQIQCARERRSCVMLRERPSVPTSYRMRSFILCCFR